MTLEEKILRRIPLEILLAACVLAAPVAFIFDALTSIFVLAGAAVSAAAFIWLRESLGKALLKGKKDALKTGIILYTLRLLLIIGVFLIIIFLFPKKILAFAAGFSTVIPVFLVEGVRALASSRPWKN
jgi:hypothetical protein